MGDLGIAAQLDNTRARDMKRWIKGKTKSFRAKASSRRNRKQGKTDTRERVDEHEDREYED